MKLRVLDEEGLVEAELVDQRQPLRLGMVLPQHVVTGSPTKANSAKAMKPDDEQDRDSLQKAGNDEGRHSRPW